MKDKHGLPDLHVKAADTGYIIKFLACVLPRLVPGAEARAAFGHRLPKGVVRMVAAPGPYGYQLCAQSQQLACFDNIIFDISHFNCIFSLSLSTFRFILIFISRFMFVSYLNVYSYAFVVLACAAS